VLGADTSDPLRGAFGSGIMNRRAGFSAIATLNNSAVAATSRARGSRCVVGHFMDFGYLDFGYLLGSSGNSTVPAIATHCSLGTATMRPSVFWQLPDPS
jgi:hypothetical protein